MSREATRDRLAPRLGRWFPGPSRHLDIMVLAVLAYLPALASSPGRMPADTKLYLYTDPGGLLGRAASTFEPDQFAGWVPHQQITYLWPSGPWFWLLDALAVPDWIAHRLWIGTIMFVAGTGVRQCARLLGHTGGPVLAAAVVYQLSPALLPYISRTSLLLLPWAGLGWIVAATIRATRVERHGVSWLVRWREPAVIGLIVVTVGSANATALAMVVPAPTIWLLSAAVRRTPPVADVVRIVARVAMACVAVSFWWMAMLIVQSRSGAPVLLYSETLEDVSRNSTGSEVLRGLGYWLFYGRDAFSATTTSSLGYLTRTSGILASFAVSIIGLVGIGFGRGEHRRFAGLLAFFGMALAVGVHPFGNSSPLVQLLTGGDDTGLALALRSSTRALPVMTLGIALGAAALIERVPARPVSMPRLSISALSGPTWRLLAAGLVIVATVGNMPPLWKAQLLDPAIDRDADVPTAWVDAATRLDADDSATRILQLPGAEFGAFDWGYTVDPPLVSTTDRPVVTRDLLPLGSAPAMNLLYAFDDRVQQGVLEPASVAPLARLLAVGTIWLAGDTDSLRFRTPSANEVGQVLNVAPGIAAPETFGAPTDDRPNSSAALDLFGRPLVDADEVSTPPDPTAAVVLYDVDEAFEITRVKTEQVIVSGAGDGVIDAAAAGLIDGTELIRYGASVDTITSADHIIITDSNRDRAHHWRSSQDVTGHTEPGGPDPDVLITTAADQRLDALGSEGGAETQTIAIQRGPVTAVASSYGEPFAYRAEDRAVMAIDGDPATAWSVGDHGDPVGAVLRLTADEPIRELVLHQLPASTGGRQISAVDIVSGGAAHRVELTASSTDGSGQRVDLDAVSGDLHDIDILIASVTVGDQTLAVSRDGVGFTEIDTGLGATTELIRPPVETLQRIPANHGPLDIVMTRERVAATSFWRSDPEPELRRLIPLDSSEVFDVEVTVRLDQRSDDVQLAELLGDEGAIADRRLPGIAHRGSAAVDGDLATAWLTPIDDVVGATLRVSTATEAVTVLDLVQPTGSWSTISQLVVSGPEQDAVVEVPAPDTDGRSAVPLPVGVVLAGAPFSLTISQVVPLVLIERRYGDEVTMPAGISELTGTSGVDAPLAAPDQPVSRRCDAPLLTIDGEPLPLEFTTTSAALIAGQPVAATACTGPLSWGAGEHVVVDEAAGTGFTVDRVVLSSLDRPPDAAAPAEVNVTRQNTRSRTVEVDCPAGCWLVFGMGQNTAWAASGAAGDLGAPAVVDGGFNGWWIQPTSTPETIRIRWTAQRQVTLGLAASAAAVLACIALLLVARQRRSLSDEDVIVVEVESAVPEHASTRALARLALMATGVALLVTPFWGLVLITVGAVDLAVRRWFRPVSLLAITGVGAAAYVALAVAVIERSDAPFPNAGWTTSFDHLNGLAITAVALVAASALPNPADEVA